jgi:hypothetical protein
VVCGAVCRHKRLTVWTKGCAVHDRCLDSFPPSKLPAYPFVFCFILFSCAGGCTAATLEKDGQKADSTQRSSQAVPHPSTNRALCCLTSEVKRDPVHSTRYGRQRNVKISTRPLLGIVQSCGDMGACATTRLQAHVVSVVLAAAADQKWLAKYVSLLYSHWCFVCAAYSAARPRGSTLCVVCNIGFAYGAVLWHATFDELCDLGVDSKGQNRLEHCHLRKGNYESFSCTPFYKMHFLRRNAPREARTPDLEVNSLTL